MWEGESLRAPFLGEVRSKGGIRLDTTQQTSILEPLKYQGLCQLSFFLPGFFSYLCLADVVFSVSILSIYLPAATYKW